MEINNYRAILHSIVKTEAEWNTINTVIPVNQVVYAVVSKTENVLNYYVKVGDGIHNFVELPKGNLTTAEIREIVATINQNIDTKVTLTNEPLQIYGTDENGNQTTFDFDLLGLVDDVLVKNNKDDEYHTVIEDQKAYIDLSGKIDHFDTMPLASSANEGQVIQYTGEDTEDYISGCFYESKEEHLESSITITPSVVEIESSIDKDTFESFVQPTGDMTLIFEYIEAPVESGDVSGSVVLESFWTLDGVEVELEDYGITTTGPVIDGDKLTVEYEYGYLEYHWVKKDTTDISEKVDKTHEAFQIYGTDANGEQTTYSKEAFGKVDDVQLNGTSVVDRTTKIANLEPGASDIAYTNEQYPAMQTLQDAMDKLLYITPSVSLSGGGTYEIGSTRATTSLSWTWNKAIKTQSLNQGIGSLEPTVRSYTYNTPITSNTTFTITGSDGTNTKSSSTTVSFSPKRYWGVSAKTTLTDSEIIALSNELSTSRQQTRTFNCSGGKYFYFAIKTSYCNGIAFKVGGLSFSDMISETRQFTNASGHTDSYNIYRVNNLQTGSSINVEVL